MSILQTEASFSIYNVDENSEEERQHGDSVDSKLERTVTVGQSVEGEFSFLKNVMCKIEEHSIEKDEGEREGNSRPFEDLKIEFGEPIPGVGIDGNDTGGVINPSSVDDGDDLENCYRRMVKEHPSNPLFLRNYAQLQQWKGDSLGAEKYYSRAILGDPKDSQALVQYAKLVWELYRDQDRASTYFARAIQAAPEDSNILAAHASFLWEIDDNEAEDKDPSPKSPSQTKENTVPPVVVKRTHFEEKERPASPPLHLAMGLGIDGASGGTFSDVEEYHRRMVEENPRNNFYLRNYAQFLHQTKGDLIGAEEFYPRAILADPKDGEMMAQYANLVWQLHHDKDLALFYSERAVKATPEDSNVLASHAKFLWEIEDDDDEDIAQEAHG